LIRGLFARLGYLPFFFPPLGFFSEFSPAKKAEGLFSPSYPCLHFRPVASNCYPYISVMGRNCSPLLSSLSGVSSVLLPFSRPLSHRVSSPFLRDGRTFGLKVFVTFDFFYTSISPFHPPRPTFAFPVEVIKHHLTFWLCQGQSLLSPFAFFSCCF